MGQVLLASTIGMQYSGRVDRVFDVNWSRVGLGAPELVYVCEDGVIFRDL